jgi:glucose-6-phosphate 1-dehydrogenase
MEPPSSLSDDSVRDEKIKVLRALKPIGAGEVKTHTVRGQYTAGAVAGEAVNGYAEQLKDGKSSQTETFVAIKLEVDNWRWSGIPFYLRTGKRLERKHSEILIQFKQVPHSIFDTEHFSTLPNRLSIMLQPDEGMKLNIMAKEPGPGGFKLKPVSLDLSFEQTFGVKYPDSYERLLMEIFRGNQALFMRRDEIETAWQWTDSILEGWKSAGQSLEYYKAGSWGPTGAFLMLDRDDRHWATG